MPKVIRFNTTYFECNSGGESRPKFIAGEYYPVTDVTLHHVATGIAEEIDAPDDVNKALAVADKLQDKAANIVGAAHDAQAAAEAAQAAQEFAAQDAAAPAETAPLDEPPAAGQ